VTSSAALKWCLTALLPLTLAWKTAVAPHDPNEVADEIVEFLSRQQFEVTMTSETSNFMPIIQAASGACLMQVAQIEADGTTGDFIRDRATATDNVFIVFRGRVYDEQPVFATVLNYLWSKFLYQLGLMHHINPVVGVVATASCAAKQLPWESLHQRISAH
jgi:hypothetical protein